MHDDDIPDSLRLHVEVAVGEPIAEIGDRAPGNPGGRCFSESESCDAASESVSNRRRIASKSTSSASTACRPGAAQR